MDKIRILTVALPADEEKRARLETLLPDTKIVYTQFMKATREEVLRSDIIFGNVLPDHLRETRNIKWIQLASAGSDRYVKYLPAKTLLTNATGAYGGAISEHMLAMLLAAQKKLFLYHENMKAEKWWREGTVQGIEGSVVLCVGLGDIGGKFAKKAKALGAYTIGVRRADTRKPDFIDELYTTESLDELLPRADIVALSLPKGPETDGIMDERRISMMKKGSIFINVGRGSAVDQDALVRALNSEHLGYACLDVTTPDPLPKGNPLWTAKNLILTPHSAGGWTLPSTLDEVYNLFERNLHAFLGGEPLANLVDPATGYRRTPL